MSAKLTKSKRIVTDYYEVVIPHAGIVTAEMIQSDLSQVPKDATLCGFKDTNSEVTFEFVHAHDETNMSSADTRWYTVDQLGAKQAFSACGPTTSARFDAEWGPNGPKEPDWSQSLVDAWVLLNEHLPEDAGYEGSEVEECAEYIKQYDDAYHIIDNMVKTLGKDV